MQPNHLIGLKQKYLKLSFSSQTDLIKVRKAILPFVKKNAEREKSNTFYNEMMANALSSNIGDVQNQKLNQDHMENIIDIRYSLFHFIYPFCLLNVRKPPYTLQFYIQGNTTCHTMSESP